VSPINEEDYCVVRAWNVDLASDVRLKVCGRISGENFIGIYRSLGEIYFHRATNAQDVLFRIGDQSELLAALGGAVALSVTPTHLNELGLLPDADLEESRVTFLLKQALDVIGGAPFGLVVDTWRSLVLSGETGADSYNTVWWDLRRKYEGIRPAAPRSAIDFDPGSDRDVLMDQAIASDLFSEVLKFQIHRDLCNVSGFEGNLSECSIYRSSEAGLRLTEMMTIEAGASRRRLLYLLTGAHQLNATALLEYFLPLSEWLQTKNEGQRCGW
jgi:peptidyl-dipeptidase A